MSVYLIDYENVHFSGWEGIDALTEQDEVVLFYSDNASTIPMSLSIKVAQAKAHVQYIHVDRMAKNYLDFQLSSFTGYLVATTEQTEFVVVSNDTGFDAILDFWNEQEFVGRKLTFRRRTQIAENSEREIEEEKISKQEENRRKQQIEIIQSGRKKPQGGNKKAAVKEPAKKTPEKKAPEKKTPAKPKPAPGAKLTKEEKEAVRVALTDVSVVPSDFIKIYKLLRTSTDKHEYNIALVKAFQDQEKGNQIYKATLKLLEERL